MSRFNTLYHGRAEEAADELEVMSAEGGESSDAALLRAALINALRRIDRLERHVSVLTGQAVANGTSPRMFR